MHVPHPGCWHKTVFYYSELFQDPASTEAPLEHFNYLTLTRPDISFTVNKLSQFLQAPTELQWQACKRVLRYIKGTQYHGLQFRPAASLNVECYADADWGSNLDDRRSTSGYCVYLGPNLIQWSSRKQRVVALSSTEAEYRALAHTATEIAWLQIIWCVNVSAGALAANPVFHSRTKHIEIDIITSGISSLSGMLAVFGAVKCSSLLFGADKVQFSAGVYENAMQF
ncbi:secreted RxLR effector protein 161-like [Pistacia vera]|uniref:secreted RxLR effector protein 161-like n=1 Tax=Pistacia vera TaxID=55513 RepID=UPI001262C9DE|nr:secreted RxLR effector protein 161-like [Pistacia vera]